MEGVGCMTSTPSGRWKERSNGKKAKSKKEKKERKREEKKKVIENSHIRAFQQFKYFQTRSQRTQ